jgi:hypothetical protein
MERHLGRTQPTAQLSREDDRAAITTAMLNRLARLAAAVVVARAGPSRPAHPRTERGAAGGSAARDVNGDLTVDMSRSGRPAAHGFGINPSTVFARFPDGALRVGTVPEAGYVHWLSNTYRGRPIVT